MVAISLSSSCRPNLLTTNCYRVTADLPLLRSALRRLQRIHRRRTRESAALSWRLLRLTDHDVTAVRAGNAALNHQQIFFLIHAQDAQVAGRDPGIAHVARPPHALEHTRRKRRRSKRTRNLKHRAVRLRAAGEVMPLHHTLKAMALARSNHIDKALAFKNIHQDSVARFDHTLGRFARSIDLYRNEERRVG